MPMSTRHRFVCYTKSYVKPQTQLSVMSNIGGIFIWSKRLLNLNINMDGDTYKLLK